MKKITLLIALFSCVSHWVSSQCSGVAVCDNNVQITLGNTAESNTISIGNFEETYDNCIDFYDYQVKIEDLDFNLIKDWDDSLHIDCSMVGQTFLFYVEVDGSSTCWGNVSIEDPFLYCVMLEPDEVPVIMVSGNGIVNLEGLDVQLNATPIEKLYNTLFYFNEMDPVAGSNTLTFDESSVDVPQVASVSTLDLVLGQRLFFEDTIYPAQAIVMDVNGSGGVNSADLITMREIILNMPSSFASNFAFILDDYPFPSDFNPYDFDFDPLSYTFEDTDLATTDFTFGVYKIGNVNETDSLTNGEVVVRNNTLLKYTDAQLNKDEVYDMTLVIDDAPSIIGLQMNLQFADASILSISSDYSGSDLLYNVLDDASANVSFLKYAGVENFKMNVQIKPNKDGLLSDFIQIGTEIENEIVFDGFSYSSMELEALVTSTEDPKATAFVHVYPNPASDVLNIEANGLFEYQLFDMKGKLITAGNAQDVVQLNMLSHTTNSMLLLKVNTSTNSTVHKIVAK